MTARQDSVKITQRLIDRATLELGRKPDWVFGRLQKLVERYVTATHNDAQVELVFRSILRQGRWESIDWLSWDQYTLFRRALEVPDGAWTFALWADGLTAGSRLRRSADYWLGLWADSIEAGNAAEQDQAAAMLGRLRDRAETMEVAAW